MPVDAWSGAAPLSPTAQTADKVVDIRRPIPYLPHSLEHNFLRNLLPRRFDFLCKIVFGLDGALQPLPLVLLRPPDSLKGLGLLISRH